MEGATPEHRQTHGELVAVTTDRRTSWAEKADAISAIMFSNAESPLVQLEGVRSLCHIASIREGSDAVACSLGVAAVMAAMEAHATDASVLIAGSEALRVAASSSPSNLCAVVNSGGIECAVEAAKSMPLDAAVQGAALGALAEMTDVVAASSTAGGRIGGGAGGRTGPRISPCAIEAVQVAALTATQLHIGDGIVRLLAARVLANAAEHARLR